MSGISKLFGAGDVVKHGFDLIDSMYDSETEIIAEKVKGKVGLLNAYAPFKLMQRVLGLLFSINFIITFWLCMYFKLSGQIEDFGDVIDVLNAFYIGEITLSIVLFYFGGGFLEGSIRARNEGKDNGIIK